MIFFSFEISFVKTPALPVSEPVPAVVGIATIGKIFLESALVHQSSMSSKSHMGLSCLDIKAIPLPTSIADPPPTATIPS